MDRLGLENMLLEAVSGLIADWWWLIAGAVTIAILHALNFGTRSRRYRRRSRPRRAERRQQQGASRRSSVVQLRAAHRAKSPIRTIAGKAYVTDGDGVQVAGQEVRLVGLDAPEWDQRAKHQDGYWFNHGRRVKSALIRACQKTGIVLILLMFLSVFPGEDSSLMVV